MTPEWWPALMGDVRPGDVVRPCGSGEGAERRIIDRYYPPDKSAGTRRTPRGRNSWHVVAGEKHWDDRIVREQDVCVVWADTPSLAVFMRGAFPIEIQLYPAEKAAIDMLGGWANRERMITAE